VEYLKKSFTVGGGVSNAYRDNYDRIFKQDLFPDAPLMLCDVADCGRPAAIFRTPQGAIIIGGEAQEPFVAAGAYCRECAVAEGVIP
jgi:hypothetical protein